MDSKGQGISMNVIIIAALALLVLVVLSIIFLGRTGQWSSQTVDCVTNGGTCMDSCADQPGYKHYPAWDGSCQEGGSTQVCCIKIA